jgi:hypothetical protein
MSRANVFDSPSYLLNEACYLCNLSFLGKNWLLFKPRKAKLIQRMEGFIASVGYKNSFRCSVKEKSPDM